jgi:hypothetical protein
MFVENIEIRIEAIKKKIGNFKVANISRTKKI